jgi:hypothetical protein
MVSPWISIEPTAHGVGTIPREHHSYAHFVREFDYSKHIRSLNAIRQSRPATVARRDERAAIRRA